MGHQLHTATVPARPTALKAAVHWQTARALGQRKRRRGGRLRSLPRHGEPFRLGGGPLTSMASLFATTSASGQNLSGHRRPRKRPAHVHFAFSGKTRAARPGRRALANEKTRREPLEEPSAPVQAPSRTGRRASHLDGLALCVSTFASAGETIRRALRPARFGRPRLPQRAGKSAALAGSPAHLRRRVRPRSRFGS
jgi:hypothetical protein